MPAEVYIWPPFEENVGHSSMKLSDGTYISYWPSEKVSKEKPECPPSLAGSVEEDASNEKERDPNIYVVEISDSGEKKIKEWWDKYKTTHYHVAFNNCSTIIFLALERAFPFLSVFDGKIKAWVPDAIGMMAYGLGTGRQFFTGQNVAEITKVAENEAKRLAGSNAGKMARKTVSKYFKLH